MDQGMEGVLRRLDGLEARLSEVERRLAIRSPARTPPTAVEPPALGVAPTHLSELVARRRGATSEPAGHGAPSTVPAPAPTPAARDRERSAAERARPARPERSAIDFESLIGGRLFAILGACALVLSVGLFLKLAYDQGWIGMISPAGKCLSAAGFGVLLIGAGEFVRRRINAIASIGLNGAGIAILYGSVFASHATYELIGMHAALGLLIGVTGLGVGIGVLTRVLSIAVLSLLGAYAAPIIVSSVAPSAVFFPSYLAVLMALGLVLSAWIGGRFQRLRTLVWWATGGLGTLWLISTGIDHPTSGLVFIGAIWALVHGELALASRLPARLRPSMGEESPSVWWRTRWLAGTFSTTAWSAFFGIVLVREHSASLDWLPAAVLAVVTFGLAMAQGSVRPLLAARPATPRAQLGAALLLQSGAMIITAIAIGVGGWMQVLTWLALSAACLTAGRWIGSRPLDLYAVAVLAIATARLVVLDAFSAWSDDSAAVFAGLGFTTWTAQMALAAVCWMYVGLRELPFRGTWWRRLGAGAICIGHAVLGASLVHEQSAPESIALAWLGLSLILLAVNRLILMQGISLYGLSATLGATVLLLTQGLQLNVNDASSIERFGLLWGPWIWQCLVFAAGWFGVERLVRGTVYDDGPSVSGPSFGLATFMLMVAPLHPAAEWSSIGLVWLLMGALLGAGRLVWRRAPLDVMSAAPLLGAIAAWAGAYVLQGWSEIDAALLGHPGLWLGLGIMTAMAVIGGIMMRGRRKDDPRWPVAALLLAGATAVGLASTSLEAGRIAAETFPQDDTSRRAVLSIWWAILGAGAVVAGFVIRLLPMRFLGLGLVGLALGKAVIYDMAEVSPAWRVATFVGLGLLMVGVALGYQRLGGMRSEAREMEVD